MDYLIFIIMGMVVGGGITYFITLSELKPQRKPSGTFVIDVSDPMKDICKFEMDESLESIYSKKQIILNVKTYDENSSK